MKRTLLPARDVYKRQLSCSRSAASREKSTVVHAPKKSASMVTNRKKPITPRRSTMEYMMVNGYQIPALTLNEPPMPEILSLIHI